MSLARDKLCTSVTWRTCRDSHLCMGYRVSSAKHIMEKFQDHPVRRMLQVLRSPLMPQYHLMLFV